MKIKFFLEYEPTVSKKLAMTMFKFGGILLLPYLILAYLLQDIPSGMRFILRSGLTEPLNPLLFTGIGMIVLGTILNLMKWRFGELTVTENQIQIRGKKEIRITYNSILETYIIESKPKQLRIDSKCYDIMLVFNSIEERDEILALTGKEI